MQSERNQNVENTTEENTVLAEPKQDVAEPISVVEETPAITEVVKPITKSPAIKIINEKIKNEDTGLPRSEELAKTTEETEQPQPIHQNQTQKTPTPTQQPQTKTIEKIIYQTPSNLIQNLLNKARAKIQERKRKKLNKIMSLFESNSEISNSDIQKLLRTTKRSATRYLNQLEKEQKITQVGKVGRGVKYIRI